MANRALVSEGASVSTPSGEFGGNVVGRTIDEDDSTYWNATQSVPNSFLLVDLGVNRDVTYLKLNQGAGNPTQESATAIDVQTSTDNVNWSTQEAFADLESGISFFVLAGGPITARYWRLDPTAGGSFGWCVRTLEIHDGSVPDSAARATQSSAEALVSPTTLAARVTQAVTETLVLPANRKVRPTQVAVEVLIQPSFVHPRAYAQVIG